MKLFRHGAPGREKPGLLDTDGKRRDLSGIIDDVAPHTLGDDELQRLRDLDAGTLPEVAADVRLGPPVSPIRKIVCIGLNYSDHAEESGMPIPASVRAAITMRMPSDRAALMSEGMPASMAGWAWRHAAHGLKLTSSISQPSSSTSKRLTMFMAATSSTG